MNNEIIEGNKLIADSPFSHEGMRESIADDKSRGYDDDYCYRSLKYDSSWDWLMPVVEKIESMGYVVEIKKRWIEIHSDNEIRNIQNYIEPKQSKIEAVWFVVIEFIKWYNIQIEMTKLQHELA